MEIDLLIHKISNGGQHLEEGVDWKCHICGVGKYQSVSGQHYLLVPMKQESGKSNNDQITALINGNRSPSNLMTTVIHSCDHCGNIQLFWYQNSNRPKGWSPSLQLQK
jgi:hypothetical protein